jgi:hypothetical protein
MWITGGWCVQMQTDVAELASKPGVQKRDCMGKGVSQPPEWQADSVDLATETPNEWSTPNPAIGSQR